MSEPDTSETQEAESTEEPVTEAQPSAPEKEPVVEIKTPLDRPEFNWFVDGMMERLGLRDRKQTAIMLSQMLQDMGMDPYADLEDVKKAITQMNSLLRQLPSTPTSERVKDTLGGMLAAKTGREILASVPRMTSSDTLMERFERIMDKYAPMMIGARMMGEMFRGGESHPQSQTPQQPQITPSDLANAVATGVEKALKTIMPYGGEPPLVGPRETEEEMPQWAKDLQEGMKAINERQKKEDEETRLEERIEKATDPLKQQVAGIQRMLETKPSEAPKSKIDEYIDTHKSLKAVGIIREPEPTTPSGLPPEEFVASKTIDKGEKIASQAMQDVKETVSELLEFQLEREKRATSAQAPKLPQLSEQEKLKALQEASGEKSPTPQ